MNNKLQDRLLNGEYMLQKDSSQLISGYIGVAPFRLPLLSCNSKMVAAIFTRIVHVSDQLLQKINMHMICYNFCDWVVLFELASLYALATSVIHMPHGANHC